MNLLSDISLTQKRDIGFLVQCKKLEEIDSLFEFQQYFPTNAESFIIVYNVEKKYLK